MFYFSSLIAVLHDMIFPLVSKIFVLTEINKNHGDSRTEMQFHL